VSQSFISDIVVVDTNVVSYIWKGDTRGTLYTPHLKGRQWIIAAQTFAELEAWPLKNGWGARRHEALRAYLSNYTFAEVDKAICLQWAKGQVNAKLTGRPITEADAWIAATALAFAVPLVIHNHADFKNVPGLTVITEQ
jgi:predicted nucleic acid-binding protein